MSKDKLILVIPPENWKQIVDACGGVEEAAEMLGGFVWICESSGGTPHPEILDTLAKHPANE